MDKKTEDQKRKQKEYREKTACKVGEVYSVTPQFTKCRVDSGVPMRGKVVFIPKHRRYAVLAFNGIHGISRECFWPEDLTVKCKPKIGFHIIK